jgi:hypothetical protein
MIGGIVLLGLLGTLLLSGAVREGLVKPLLNVVWTVYVLVNVFPQAAVWGVFMTLALLLAWRSMGREFKASRRTKAALPPDQGRVETLTHWVKETAYGEYFRHKLVRHITDLLLEARGYPFNLPERRVDELIRSNALNLPADVHSYLSTGLVAYNDLALSVRKSPVTERLRRDTTPNPPTIGDDPTFQATLRFLEHELEIIHEQQSLD